MCDWTDCSGREASGTDANMTTPNQLIEVPHPQPHDHASTCTSGGPRTNGERFSTFVDDEELAALSKGVVPAGTDKCTKWALANFAAWKKARNKKHPDDPVPEDIFTCIDPATLNTHISRFVLETRKSNGDFYPPKTLHQLLCGVLRHMRAVNPGCLNFLDKKDSRFKLLHGTMDSHFHHLHATGVGRETKHARVLTRGNEDKLWNSGVMGTRTPRALQNAVFYVVGKMFSLRGGVEVRQVKISQIRRHANPDKYVYTELVSKNSSGTYKKLHIANKVVPVFACPQAGERCPVYVLDLYFSKLPQEAFKQDILFVRPLENVSDDPTKPWYSSVPVGKNILDTKLGKMCSLAGIEGRVTNHSMRATSVTQMYETGVPEKVIQERTGHRSLEALRVYERTNAQQHQAVSSVLAAQHTCVYNEQHSTFSTVSLEPHPNRQNISVSFQNLHGCTININNTPPNPSFNFSQAEVDELSADF